VKQQIHQGVSRQNYGTFPGGFRNALFTMIIGNKEFWSKVIPVLPPGQIDAIASQRQTTNLVQVDSLWTSFNKSAF
jgi:hypothetical protein